MTCETCVRLRKLLAESLAYHLDEFGDKMPPPGAAITDWYRDFLERMRKETELLARNQEEIELCK